MFIKHEKQLAFHELAPWAIFTSICLTYILFLIVTGVVVSSPSQRVGVESGGGTLEGTKHTETNAEA
jgi:hypothetical protein